MTIDGELPQQVRQAIGATKSVLMVFFNPKEFAIADLLRQDTSFRRIPEFESDQCHSRTCCSLSRMYRKGWMQA
jgi:hypothetical protein